MSAVHTTTYIFNLSCPTLLYIGENIVLVASKKFIYVF